MSARRGTGCAGPLGSRPSPAAGGRRCRPVLPPLVSAGQGLCMPYVSPSERPQAAPRRTSPFSGSGGQRCQCVPRLQETLGHLWRAKGSCGVGGLTRRRTRLPLQLLLLLRRLCHAFPRRCSARGALSSWWSWGRMLLFSYVLETFVLPRSVASVSNIFLFLNMQCWLYLLNFVSAFEFR